MPHVVPWRGTEATVSPVSRQYDRLRTVRVGAGTWRFERRDDDPRGGRTYTLVFASTAAVLIRSADSLIDLSPRSLTLLPGTTPFTVEVPAGAVAAAVHLSPDSIAADIDVFEHATGRAWSTEIGTASLVAHLLDGIVHQLEAYVPSNPMRLEVHLVGFLAMMCAETVPGRVDDVSPNRAILRGAKDYIEQSLADLALTPDAVAAAVNVSTRTLHRLFEQDGETVGGWIRRRRLENCRLALGEPANRMEPVSAIGARWGMWDAAHFSRTFKAAFGLSPREYRSRADAARLGVTASA